MSLPEAGIRGCMFVVVLLFWAILLSACSTVPHAVCAPLKDYPPEFSQRLATELEAMPADSATVEAIGDYVALRDSVRACKP